MLGVVLVKHLLSNGGVHCGRSNISNVGYLYNNVGVDSVLGVDLVKYLYSDSGVDSV